MKFGQSENPAQREGLTAEWFQQAYNDRGGAAWRDFLELRKAVESQIDAAAEKGIDLDRISQLAEALKPELEQRDLDLDPEYIVTQAVGMLHAKIGEIMFTYRWDKFQDRYVRRRRFVGPVDEIKT